MLKIIAPMCALFLAGCSDASKCGQTYNLTVETVYTETCTMEADYPECRVELSNGKRVNLEAPILAGDELWGCLKNDGRVVLWRSETNHRSLMSAIGSYRK